MDLRLCDDVRTRLALDFLSIVRNFFERFLALRLH
jgi:hypothetical protein